MYQNCRDLRAFIGVKFGLKIFLRVKDLTFCNSGDNGKMKLIIKMIKNDDDINYGNGDDFKPFPAEHVEG